MVVSILVLLIIIVEMIRTHRIESTDRILPYDQTMLLRGLASIAVASVHIPTEYANFVSLNVGRFSSFAVSLFFFLSGYGLQLATQNNRAYISKIGKKCICLLIPWVIMYMVKVIFDVYWGTGGVLYVIVLMFFYLIFWCAHKVFRSNLATVSTIFGANVLYMVSGQIKLPMTSWYAESLGFAAGVIFAYVLNNKTGTIQRLLSIKNTVVFIVGAIITTVLFVVVEDVPLLGYIMKATSHISYIMILIVMMRYVNIKSNFLKVLGNYSYEVFLTHGICYVLVVRMLPGINTNLGLMISIILIGIMCWALRRVTGGIQKCILEAKQR